MQHAVEKTFLVAQPVQPVALTSKVACYQSRIASGGLNRQNPAEIARRDPPRRGGRFSPDWHPQVPVASRVGCLPGQRGTAPLQKVDGFMHGPCETSETGETWTILAWYLYFFIQNWKCRTSTKETKVPPGHPPLPLSTTRLLGTKS